jgi:hypothetical protein
MTARTKSQWTVNPTPNATMARIASKINRSNGFTSLCWSPFGEKTAGRAFRLRGG